MRILSQDGIKFDIEYENCRLVVNEKCCEIEVETSNPNFTPVMASYSCIEKCRKAMDMLHEAYMAHSQCNSMTAEQKALFIMSVSEKEQCNLYGMFRFPTEEELED